MGLNNAILPPPYFPAGRGEDLIFARLLTGLWRDRFILHVPMSLSHTRPAAPVASVGQLTMGLEVITALSLLLDHFQPIQVSSNSSTELERLGVFLETLGSEPHKSFDLLCREAACKYWANQSYTYSSLIEEYKGKPTEWAEHAERFARFARQQAVLNEPFAPFDLAGNSSGQKSLLCFQELIRDYGKLLQLWPALHRAAREIAPDFLSEISRQ